MNQFNTYISLLKFHQYYLQLNMWAASISRIDISYQHIYIMHIDTRYKWKPIKGENHILLLLWCKGKLQLPLTTVFCRHQPTGGSYLNFASYNLQGSTNSLQFSLGTNLQEAPTSVSYNWQLSSCNLIGKLQLPQFIKLNVCWFTPNISYVLYLFFFS